MLDARRALHSVFDNHLFLFTPSRYLIASPLRDARGNIIAGIEVMRDITERQRLEQEVFKGRQLESLGVLA